MNTIHALAGPPASGKTTTIHKFKHVLGIADDMILDDVRAHPNWVELVKSKVSIGNIIIADIMFSDPGHRKHVDDLGFPVVWYSMDPSPAQCMRNACFRCVYMMPKTYSTGGRNIDLEFRYISELALVYEPFGIIIEGPKLPEMSLGTIARAISGCFRSS